MGNRPEPAAFAGVLAAVLAVLVSFSVPGLSTEYVALIMAFVNAALGLYVAWKTNATLLGAILTVVNTGFALASGYGFNLTEQQQGALLALVPVVLGLFQRTQVSPLAKGNFTLAA